MSLHSFQDKELDEWKFSLDYAENFLRWYVAFRWREPAILDQAGVKLSDLLARIRAITPLPGDLKGILTIIEGLEERGITVPDKTALRMPREISDRHEKTIVMFLDEFQNTRLPHYGFDIVGLMQAAVESPTCPHFVTGSAMSILAKEILGRGALFGRFESDPIDPLTRVLGGGVSAPGRGVLSRRTGCARRASRLASVRRQSVLYYRGGETSRQTTPGAQQRRCRE